ncbi:nuclear cap-binding protein complex subunit 1 [Monosporozyma unispora]|nr:hypothetical protein C6P44_003449 [Kazachstania unispora]
MSGRKRRNDFDDDDYYQQEYRPRFQKKQRVPPVVQLCKEMMPDITTIGESKKAFEDDIKFLGEAIINEFGHEEYFNNALLSTLKAVVLEQPHKQPAIALLTITVNAQNEVAGKTIINYFFEELQSTCNNTVKVNELNLESNETGPWNKIKLLLRFLSLLSPILLNDDIINIYSQLFNLAVELNNLDAEKRNPLAEAIYTNTLADIPYLFYLSRSDSDLQSRVDQLVSNIESSFKIKTTDLSLLREYNSATAPYEIVELPQVVLPNVKKMLANNMEQLEQLFMNWTHLLPESQNGDQGFNDALQLPSCEDLKPYSFFNSTKNVGSVDGMWRTPYYVFHVYLPQSTGDFETVVPATTYAGELFRDIFIDVVEGLEFNRREVAKQVMMLDLFFQEKFFAEQGVSIADLIETYEQDPLASTFKIEDIVIETILSLVFKLPSVSQPFAYFYTLLVDICQNSPKAIAPVFGRAFRFFYNNVDNLDFELKLRFLDWFSIQMSNFNFSWKWNEWENDSKRFSASNYSPKISFMKNLVRKELRLTSTPSEVDASLPEEFKQYMDTSYFSSDILISIYESLVAADKISITEEDVKSNDLIFKQDKFPFASIVSEILDYIHKPNDTRDVAELELLVVKFKEGDEPLSNNITNLNKFIVFLLTQCVVHCGSRSLSHANKYINDLHEDLKTIWDKLEIPQDVRESTIIEAVLSYWNINSQNGYLIVDAFKFVGLVSTRSIYNFCFFDWSGKVFGLTDVTSIDTVFRTLSTQLKMVKAEESIETGVEDFEIVFEKICVIINDTITALGFSTDQVVEIPEITETTEVSVEELQRLDLLWKYTTAVSFTKSLLRKYSVQFKQLAEKLSSGMETAIPHVPTRNVLLKWVKEVEEL